MAGPGVTKVLVNAAEKNVEGYRVHKVGRCHGDEFENVHIHVASDCKVMDKWLFSLADIPNMMVLSVAVAKSAQTAGIKPERLVAEAVKRWGELSRKQENCLRTRTAANTTVSGSMRGAMVTQKNCFVLEVEMPSSQASGCEECLINRTS